MNEDSEKNIHMDKNVHYVHNIHMERSSNNNQAIYDYTKSIEQIAASLAHDVKNPLSLVKANVDLLEFCDSDGKYKKNYAIMRNEIDKINDMLLEFIQYTRPVEMISKKLRVQEMIYGICDNFQSAYPNEFTFTINLSDDNLYIRGDEKKLTRVFENIVKNAFEAKVDTCHLEISLERKDGFIKIIFKDNGTGISDETMKKINTPFYTTKEKGSGMGLFITRSIISSHDGIFDIAPNEDDREMSGASEMGSLNEMGKLNRMDRLNKMGKLNRMGCTITIMLPEVE